jgi:sulfate adenylyltransferase subunit 1 (EFTu-like GTPase family)
LIFKLNRAELNALAALEPTAEREVLSAALEAVAARNKRPAFVTLAEEGILGAFPGTHAQWVPSLALRGPIDIVGAGDSVTAALTAGLAAGATLGEALELAMLAASVTVHLETNLDVSRGDMLCRPANKPMVGQDLDAMVCWMSDQPLTARSRLAIKHTTRWVRAMVTNLQYKLDVNTLHREDGVTQFGLNDIGRVQLRTTAPLFYDEYRRNRTTGSFLLVDESTNQTVGAGMLLSEPR